MRVRALDVVVGLPSGVQAQYAAFPRVDDAPDVALDEVDPVLLSGAFTHAVVDRTAYLAVHAAVAHAAPGAIVLPGSSGTGKSTLTLALVRAGFGLMSDELAAFDRDDAGDVAVHAFARPLTLDAERARVLGLDVREPAGQEVAIDVHGIGRLGPTHAPVAAVVLPQRVPSGPARLDGADPGDAAAELIRHGFNHYRRPAPNLRTIATLAASSTVLRLTYSEADEAAETLSRRFGAR